MPRSVPGGGAGRTLELTDALSYRIALNCAHYFASLRVKTERTPSLFGNKLLAGNFIFVFITIIKKTLSTACIPEDNHRLILYRVISFIQG